MNIVRLVLKIFDIKKQLKIEINILNLGSGYTYSLFL